MTNETIAQFKMWIIEEMFNNVLTRYSTNIILHFTKEFRRITHYFYISLLKNDYFHSCYFSVILFFQVLHIHELNVEIKTSIYR